MTPSSPFTSEAERLRAREAMVECVEYEFDTKAEAAEVFDAKFPPIVDAPEEPPVNVPDGEFVNERYWCGCVRESRWVPRCERHKDNEHDEEPMTRGEEMEQEKQHPTPPDFDAAVDEFSNAVDVLVEYLMTDHPDTDRARSSRDAARAALLAFYAEPVGEVFEVEPEDHHGGPLINLPYGKFKPGQRVRVVKVEP